MGLKINSIQIEKNFEFGNVPIGGKDNIIIDNSLYSTILSGHEENVECDSNVCKRRSYPT